MFNVSHFGHGSTNVILKSKSEPRKLSYKLGMPCK